MSLCRLGDSPTLKNVRDDGKDVEQKRISRHRDKKKASKLMRKIAF